MIEVILKVDIDKLGCKGEVKKVKDGYARNFLIPNGLAMESSSASIKILKEEQVKQRSKEEKEKENALALAAELSSHSYTISRKAGVDDKLFGAVTAQDIADCIRQKAGEIDKKKVQLEEPIKQLGVYQIPVKVYPEVVATIKVWIVKE